MRKFERIVATPGTVSGAPRLNGRRITTGFLASRFLGGDSVEMMANDYGEPREAIEEAIAFEFALARRLKAAKQIVGSEAQADV
jgi:uncharacterized protein (DUF433 family)